MALDVNQTVDTMLGAMKPVLGQRWEDIQKYAKGQLAALARTLATIEAERALGKISEQQATVLLDMQKNATSAVLISIQGIGEAAATEALYAGLKAIKDQVNKAVGFDLLS